MYTPGLCILHMLYVVQEDFFICGIKSINRINSIITCFTVKLTKIKTVTVFIWFDHRTSPSPLQTHQPKCRGRRLYTHQTVCEFWSLNMSWHQSCNLTYVDHVSILESFICRFKACVTGVLPDRIESLERLRLVDRAEGDVSKLVAAVVAGEVATSLAGWGRSGRRGGAGERFGRVPYPAKLWSCFGNFWV